MCDTDTIVMTIEIQICAVIIKGLDPYQISFKTIKCIDQMNKTNQLINWNASIRKTIQLNFSKI